MIKTLEEMLARADELYGARERPEQVRQSIEMLREATDYYGALWRLGRAHFFLGQEASDELEARRHHLAGTDAGSRAVRAFKRGVEGHFWLGVNLALLARIEKALVALGYALHARHELQRAVLLDPAYHAAGPLRVLAHLESKLPRLVGGGTKRAHARFEKAIRLAPANTVTRIYFAELLMQCGEMKRARTELEAVLSAPFDPAWAFEIRRDQARAREILGECGMRNAQ